MLRDFIIDFLLEGGVVSRHSDTRQLAVIQWLAKPGTTAIPEASYLWAADLCGRALKASSIRGFLLRRCENAFEISASFLVERIL